ncbi:MAG: leucine-rich repeat domain-containing protein, partial [Clostridium sp.]|nr:leucine-rich repeat domain-containing protein [Clostridium sp.]
SVESLSIGADVEDINFGGGAFVWCTELSSIEVSEDNGTYATQDGVLFQKDDEGNLSELKLFPVGDESRTSYEIPDGVWYIEQWAFFYADSLEEITIPYSVTDIGYEAFYNCYSLMSVTVPDTVTGISDHAFGWVDTDDGEQPLEGFVLYGYANTQAQWYAEGNDVTFEALDDENAEGEGDFGEDGNNLHWVLADGVLTISRNEGCDNGWMGEMSRGDAPWYDMRHSIYEVVIEGGVEHIGNYAFYTCTNLETVTVPDSVTDVGDWAFGQCPNLGSVELSDSVGWIGGYAFYRSGLTEFTIPNNSNLTEICDGTFEGTNLESISIPRRITSIGYAAFKDCGNLSEVTFTGTSKLSYIGGCAFQNCSSLISIDIPSGVTTIEDWAFQGCSALESVTLPDDEDFTRVPSGLFSDCESLTSATIPDSVAEIGNDAFANCTSLTAVNIPDGVDYIYSWTFYNCSSLESITLPDGVTCIEDEAFRDCSSLTSINLPESLTQICWAAFEGCSSLSGDLVIPDDSEAFYGCSSLTSATLPSNEEYTGIGERTFQYCSGLTSVTIPDTVTYIGGSAFEGCTSLEYIELPDSVDTIEWWAFAYCPLTQLEDDTLVISENVGWIGDHAFYACGFNNVIIYSTEFDIGDRAFGWDGDDEEEYGTLDGFTVYGYSDTSAQWYADDSGLTFVDLNWEYEGQCGDNVYWTIEDGVLTLYTEGEAEDEEQNGRMWDYDNWDDSPFAGRSDIKSIAISDGVTYLGNGAFQNCYNVESLYLGADVEDINFGGGAFVWCTSLSSIEVSADNETFYTVDDVLFRDEGWTLCLYPSCKEGESYTIPDGVGYIEQWVFYHNENLTSVTITDSVRGIGYEAFYNCINLWEVTIPDTVEYIDYHAFGFADQEDEDGNWFEEMDGFTVYGYEGIAAQDYADQYDSVNFVALEIPTVNEGGEFGTNLYWTLDEEGTLTISVVDSGQSNSMDFEAVGDAPWYEYRLSVNNIVIKTGVESIGSCAFANCSRAETVDIQADIGSVEYAAFYNCSSLTEIVIPDSVTELGDWAFQGCISLESVTLPNNDEFTDIEVGLFYGCYLLAEITIPNTVTSIGDYA